MGKTGIKSLKQSNFKCTVCQREGSRFVWEGGIRGWRGQAGSFLMPHGLVGGKPRVFLNSCIVMLNISFLYVL